MEHRWVKTGQLPMFWGAKIEKRPDSCIISKEG